MSRCNYMSSNAPLELPSMSLLTVSSSLLASDWFSGRPSPFPYYPVTPFLHSALDHSVISWHQAIIFNLPNPLYFFSICIHTQWSQAMCVCRVCLQYVEIYIIWINKLLKVYKNVSNKLMNESHSTVKCNRRIWCHLVLSLGFYWGSSVHHEEISFFQGSLFKFTWQKK